MRIVNSINADGTLGPCFVKSEDKNKNAQLEVSVAGESIDVATGEIIEPYRTVLFVNSVISPTMYSAILAAGPVDAAKLKLKGDVIGMDTPEFFRVDEATKTAKVCNHIVVAYLCNSEAEREGALKSAVEDRFAYYTENERWVLEGETVEAGAARLIA